MSSPPLTRRRLPDFLRAELARTDPSGALGPRPEVSPHPEMRFVRGRVHELCGSARRTLTLWLGALTPGPILWIMPAWGTDHLNPDGVVDLIEPERLITVTPRRGEDLLWSMEEALRSGAVSVVVCELPSPPPLTPVRRLHLAATEGGETGTHLPLGLLLTPGAGGAPGVESRWHMTAAHPPPSANLPPRWRLERRRARTQPPRGWYATRPHGRLTLTPTHDPDLAAP